MNTVVIITPFDSYSYNVRIKYIEDYFNQRGYSCIILTADFDHREKRHYYVSRDNLELLHVPEYKRNLSVARIYSHYCFSKQVFAKLNYLKPNIVYASCPPNFLFKYVSKFKKENPHVKLIFEVGDLWPETLPVPEKIRRVCYPVFYFWQRLRDNYIWEADAIVYECDLFRKIIENKNKGNLERVIYLCKEDFYKGYDNCLSLSREIKELEFAYIGSINNIIDIEFIVDVLKNLRKKSKVTLSIVGDGENKVKLLQLCEKNKISVKDYGIIYDNAIKQHVLDNCHFSFNVMKSNVVVGATMKSLEYFHWGLAVINNIEGDTWSIIERYKCGINGRDSASIAKAISALTNDDILAMQKSSRKVYREMFSEEIAKQEFNEMFDALSL